MNLSDLKKENKVFKFLHRILLITGAIAIAYIIIQLFEEYFGSRKTSIRN